MAVPTIAHLASSLPWLCPAAPQLAALAGDDHGSLRHDPASVALLLRYARPTPLLNEFTFEAFGTSSVAESAAVYLEAKCDGWRDPTHPVFAKLNEHAVRVATVAEALAVKTGACNPASAFAAGLLANLGLLAAAVIDPDAVAECVEHPEMEAAILGRPAAAITAKLFKRWKLPVWLNDPKMAAMLSALREHVAQHPGSTCSPKAVSMAPGEDPRTIALLPTLLKTAAKARRDAAAMQRTFDSTLRNEKLKSLAEFAAGAGHEINNPLAVISGNAQLLRNREEDDDRRRSLDVIIRQTGRIAELLHDVMAFARPAKPRFTAVRAGTLLQTVARDFDAQATLKMVTLNTAGDADVHIHADAGQLRKALGNLVRNAIEHSPTAGTVTVAAARFENAIRLTVTDDGDGPADAMVPHLFDPFYSGREAGRGRGMGLATAWRFARENGGEVRFDETARRTTFVMTLPAADVSEMAERKSA